MRFTRLVVIAIGSVAASSTSAVAEDRDLSSHKFTPLDIEESATETVVSPIEIQDGRIVIQIPENFNPSDAVKVSKETATPARGHYTTSFLTITGALCLMLAWMYFSNNK